MTEQTPATERPHVIRDAKGKRPQFYETPGLDEAMSMILVLASELCVVRDRMDAIERVSRARGIDLAAEVDALALDEAALAEREARRQDFMSRLYYVLRKEAGEAAAAETDASYRATIEEIAAG
jgi:hypothetical protein